MFRVFFPLKTSHREKDVIAWFEMVVCTFVSSSRVKRVKVISIHFMLTLSFSISMSFGVFA